jgi:hypothetical protein
LNRRFPAIIRVKRDLVANGAFQKWEGIRQSGRLERITASRLEQGRLMAVRTGAKRRIAMSQVEEVAARLTQARNELAPITERLLDIEVRLVAAKAADIERPAKVSLREFTLNLLDSHTGFTQDYQVTNVRQSAVK